MALSDRLSVIWVIRLWTDTLISDDFIFHLSCVIHLGDEIRQTFLVMSSYRIMELLRLALNLHGVSLVNHCR